MTTNPHRVEVTVEPDEDYAADTGEQRDRVRDVVFTCTAGPAAPCRTHPDPDSCSCESWYECDDPHLCEENGHDALRAHDWAGHPFVAGQECWVRSWFDVPDCAVYVGDDALDARDDRVPPVAARGPVTVSFEGDYIEWDWAPSEPTEVSR